jgi:hypothetical protein
LFRKSLLFGIGAISGWLRRIFRGGLFSEEPEDDGYDDAYQHHADDGDVDLQVRSVKHNIP